MANKIVGSPNYKLVRKRPDNYIKAYRADKYSVSGAVAQLLIKQFSTVFEYGNAQISSMPTTESVERGVKRQRITLHVRKTYLRQVTSQLLVTNCKHLYEQQQLTANIINVMYYPEINEWLATWCIDFSLVQFKPATFYATLTATGSDIRFSFYVEYDKRLPTIHLKGAVCI